MVRRTIREKSMVLVKTEGTDVEKAFSVIEHLQSGLPAIDEADRRLINIAVSARIDVNKDYMASILDVLEKITSLSRSQQRFYVLDADLLQKAAAIAKGLEKDKSQETKPNPTICVALVNYHVPLGHVRLQCKVGFPGSVIGAYIEKRVAALREPTEEDGRPNMTSYSQWQENLRQGQATARATLHDRLEKLVQDMKQLGIDLVYITYTGEGVRINEAAGLFYSWPVPVEEADGERKSEAPGEETGEPALRKEEKRSFGVGGTTATHGGISIG